MPSVMWTFTLAAAATLVAASSSSFSSSSDDDKFQIYAYGDEIGGFPIISAGEDAFIGDHTLIDNDELAPVIFTPDSGVLTGSPNTTAALNSSSLPTWADLKLGVPSPSSSSHTVRFASSNSTNSTDLITDEWSRYGSFVGIESNGTMNMLWYAAPSDTDGVYKLQWNDTVDSTEGLITLSLRTSAPSNEEA
ncbi:hypothetical protein GMORB2_2261 [Geosmithia morbida]|uniref:Uncharacterized protein n=1 Tax=Geosmithia morbida TaxID=1094350 RepID=A0A9P4YT40_9HYPO|nr:uncharacterized protein GMORB2_2261 [Geosmithia morbida]KAF4121299.1 hypothetical protein GMORB2_2261 [Geosmithia morbida]